MSPERKPGTDGTFPGNKPWRTFRLSPVLYWTVPALVCALVHYRGFAAWFRADDFAWLAVGQHVRGIRGILSALFTPMAQGTFRPWSERAFFMLGFRLFGLDALPFRIVIFATQFANLALVAWIGTRLTGRRFAGFLAAVFWAVNNSVVEPLGWACVYNQVLCAFFLLLAFYFLLRYVETGNARYNVCQWIVFLLGFGAMELNALYPALAATYTFLSAREFFRRTWPLFVPSLAYFAAHLAFAAGDKNPDYAVHFTGAMLRALAKYWAWSVGPLYFRSSLDLPKWAIPAAVVVISVALLIFAVRRRAALFCVAWFVIAIAPVLPLRDHFTEYYPFIPVIGLCWLGGWACAEAWRSSAGARFAAVVLTAVYVLTVTPQTLAASDWNYRITVRVRDLVEGVARAHELHPTQTIMLDGADTTLFWNGILDRPFRLIGIDRLYLTPGSEQHIDAHPDLGDVREFVLPPDVAAKALDRDELVVYDARGPRLRNITSEYAGAPRDLGPPQRVDIASPLAAPLLGPEWYQPDGNHRWMPKRATVRIAGPSAAGQKLHLSGYCPAEQLRSGPLTISIAVDGLPLHPALIHPGENSFDLSFALPAAVGGKSAMQVTIEVGRTFQVAPDVRDLGLAFGVLEVR